MGSQPSGNSETGRQNELRSILTIPINRLKATEEEALLMVVVGTTGRLFRVDVRNRTEFVGILVDGGIRNWAISRHQKVTEESRCSGASS